MIKRIEKQTICKLIFTVILSCAFLSAMYLAFGFTVGSYNSRAAMALTAAIILIASACISFFILKKPELHLIALVFLLSFGVFLVFTQPVLNIPDENAHFARAELVSRLHLFITPSDTQHETINSVGEIIASSKQSYWSSRIYGHRLDNTPFMVDHVAASNSFYSYIPQAIGIGVAKLFSLNSIWLLWLARLFNLFAYAGITALAIKIIPCFKEALLFIALLPISLQQAASASPDSLIFALSFLLIAFILHLAFSKGIKINYKQLGLLLLLCLLVALPKVTTNSLLILLILFIPTSNFEKPQFAALIKAAIILTSVIIAAIYYYSTFSYAPVSQQLDYLNEMNISSAKQMEYILQNPLHFATHFMKTLVQSLYTYIDMMNLFGWLEYGSSLLSIVIVFWLGKLCFESSNNPFKLAQRASLAVILLAYYFITVFAMYLGWTSVGVDIVAGMQGRYLIPALLLLPMIFTKKDDAALMSNDTQKLGTAILATNMTAFMLIITVTKYY